MKTSATMIVLALLAWAAMATPAQAYAQVGSEMHWETPFAPEGEECEEHSEYCEYECYAASEPHLDDACPERVYCMHHPEAHPCTGNTQECSNGFYGWDTDHDGVCDQDDWDDDGDTVPDDCDQANSAIDNAIDLVNYRLGNC